MDDELKVGEQTVGGVLPDQEDSSGNSAQQDSAGGPGWRPVVRRQAAASPDEPDAADAAVPPDEADARSGLDRAGGTAGGGYGTNSGMGSSGGSQGGGENSATGSATDFMRGEVEHDLRPGPAEPRDHDRPAAHSALPPDVQGE